MANGRPGDHPYTDIVVHGRVVYSEEVTRLSKAIYSLNDERANDLLAKLLMYTSPEEVHPSNRLLVLGELEKSLRELLALVTEAHGMK